MTISNTRNSEKKYFESRFSP